MSKLVCQQALSRRCLRTVLSLSKRHMLTNRKRAGIQRLRGCGCMGVRMNANLAKIGPQSRLKEFSNIILQRLAARLERINLGFKRSGNFKCAARCCLRIGKLIEALMIIRLHLNRAVDNL